MSVDKGNKIKIEARNGRIVTAPIRPHYTLEGLLKGTTPIDYRRTAVTWGPDRGREIVD